jgi:hypothetical protein
MDLLVTATLFSALLIAFGGVALVRPRARSNSVPSTTSPAPESGVAEANASEPTTPLARLKALIAVRDWRRALPSLLIIAGILGVMLFGSLSLVFVLGHTGAGVASLAVSLYATARLALDYTRA